MHLYYRPVVAFEFAWTTEDKVGVIEVDGLTGEVIENGQWFKEKLQAITKREMLFEMGSELAGALVPGGGTAVKVIERITAGSCLRWQASKVAWRTPSLPSTR